VSTSADEVDLLGAPYAGELSEPFYFPATAPRLFGWLHQPVGCCSSTGLVICKPFGYELLVGHRSLRAFAEMAAAAGIPTLRFDYQGSGDAAEIDPDADQIEAWSRDVVVAADELRARTGVSRICLLGFRLGALIATLAAARCEGATGLVLVAPITSGRGYLRELRRQQLAARVDVAADDPAAALAAAEAGGSVEVAGHALSVATVAALSRLELAARAVPRRASVLIIDRDDLPTAQSWYRALCAAGTDAEYLTLPGFVGMMMTAPFLTRLPYAMLEATREWLVRFAARPGIVAGSTARAAAGAGELPLSDPRSGEALSERPVRFGPGAMLFGIVSEPARGAQRAVVLMNQGADYHIGPSRMNVTLARHLARSGYAVLRMDLAGLGDSGVRSGRPANEVYPPAVMEDVRAALDFMREQYGAADLTVAGLCSGAYHALGAAATGLPLNRILLINPEAFPWKGGAPASAEQVTAGGALRARALSLAHWKKLLSGQVTLARAVTVLSGRLALKLGSWQRALLRTLRIRLTDDAARQFERIAQRGVQVTIIFSPGERGIELLQLHAGSVLRRLGESCHVHVMAGGDHTFTRSAARTALLRIVSDELG
jgi:alpha-beta hydrolase superfamily lysophospholipase